MASTSANVVASKPLPIVVPTILPTLRPASAKSLLFNILPILSGKSNISLRIIDWFVTNYAKKNNIMVSVYNKSSIFIYLDYKSQLKAYSKKQFDPFCRRDRISFIYGENSYFRTPIA